MNRIRMNIKGWKVKFLPTGARLILLQHALFSMPVHLLAILQVSDNVLCSINRMRSTFFWGVVEGKPKRKWVGWDKLCKSIDEGGVGLRSLNEVKKSLHLKFAWQFFIGNSLWAKFFKSKDVKDQHIFVVNPKKRTRFWRMVMDCIPLVLNQSKWRVKEGNVSFWRDKWMDTGPICEQHHIVNLQKLKIKEFIVDNISDVDLLVQLVVRELTDSVMCMKEGTNVLIWMGNSEGEFNT